MNSSTIKSIEAISHTCGDFQAANIQSGIPEERTWVEGMKGQRRGRPEKGNTETFGTEPLGSFLGSAAVPWAQSHELREGRALPCQLPLASTKARS